MLPTSCSCQLCLSRAYRISHNFRKYWICVLLSDTLIDMSSFDITCCILYKTIPCPLSRFRMEAVLSCWHHAMAIQIMSNISLTQMRRWIYKNRYIVHRIMFIVNFNITKNALFLFLSFFLSFFFFFEFEPTHLKSSPLFTSWRKW